MSRKTWTKQDVDALLKGAKTKNAAELAEEFGISRQAVVDKLRKLGTSLKAERGETWNDTDNDLLREHFEYAPKEYIVRLFPNRTWNSIYQHGNKELRLNRVSQDQIYVNYRFFDNWTEESAYIFGFILADGWVGYGSTMQGNKCTVQIEVNVKDINILYKIAAAMDFCGSFTKFRNSVKIGIHNQHIVQELVDKGMPYKDKSNTATFPEVPKQYLRHLIRGLIDGDGWSSYEEQYNRYIIGLCGTYDIVSNVHDLVPADLSTVKIEQSASNCYRFNVQGKKAIEIADWLYNDSHIWLTRKYQAYVKAKEIAAEG